MSLNHDNCGGKTRRELLLQAGGTALLTAAGNTLRATPSQPLTWSTGSGGYTFGWDIANDRATLRMPQTDTPVWAGGLLPALLLSGFGSGPTYVKPAVDVKNCSIDASGGTLSLSAGSLATAELVFRARDYGIEFARFRIDWRSPARPIVGLYFGTAALSDSERQAAPTLDQSFWPNWESACFCVPGAKGAPLQSVFRSWDLGHAVLPLGSFGPSLGTPYAAAYPRPLYAAAMGNQQGWVSIGSGAVPEGALSLLLESSSACLHLLYREDLWGAPDTRQRTWESPLRIAWAQDPWRAYQRLFSSFPRPQIARNARVKSQWNSWGDFKKNAYELRALANWTSSIGAEILCLDDRWESFVGSGEPDQQRFPHFDQDIQYMKSLGLAVGFWQPIGWVDQPERVDLTHEDLVVGPNGQPRRAAWDTNPRAHSHYCLDPSSPKAVGFLRHRTLRLIERYRPAVLKLDFGYGLPSPHTGVPRDPTLRGERYSMRLLEIISETAHSVDKGVSIEYYSLHPLLRDIVDVIALDDLGDAGNEEALGHRQWSIWSALAAGGSTIMASSGYDWNADAEVVLNSAVIGVPGAVLSRTMDDGSSVPEKFLNRRVALNRWYRRTAAWSPLWLNSSPGGYLQDPVMRCFGRIENIDGEDRLTALVLREQDKQLLPSNALSGARWQGSWALIAQDDQDIFRSRRLACLPVDGAELEIPRSIQPDRILAVSRSSEANWPDWTWSNGTLSLKTGSGADHLLGFLVLQ